MVSFATQVKRRRGTEAQNDEFTGAIGEIVVDLTNMQLRVHDGSTRGGFPQATQAGLDDLKNLVLSSLMPTGAIMAFAGATAPAGWLVCDGGLARRETYAALFDYISILHGDGSNGIDLYYGYSGSDGYIYYTTTSTISTDSANPTAVYNAPNLLASVGTVYASGGVNTATIDGATITLTADSTLNSDYDNSLFNLPDAVERVLWGGTNSPAYLDESLPNITGRFGFSGAASARVYESSIGGAFKTITTQGGNQVASISGASTVVNRFEFDASRGSSSYQTGGVVRPRALQSLLCIKY